MNIKTIREAADSLKQCCCMNCDMPCQAKAAVTMAIRIMQKEEPRKIRRTNYMYQYETLTCPTCGEPVELSSKRCRECGQVIDWEA